MSQTDILDFLREKSLRQPNRFFSFDEIVNAFNVDKKKNVSTVRNVIRRGLIRLECFGMVEGKTSGFMCRMRFYRYRKSDEGLIKKNKLFI